MADLVFTIRTPAELAGAQAAAKALEVNIGKAKGLGQEYAALEERLNATRTSIERFQTAAAESSKQQQAAADQVMADLPKVVNSEAKVQEATAKTFAKKKELKEMVHKLGEEFPILGQVGRLALNPIVLVTSAVTGAFVLFNTRVKELTRSLGGIAMPDIKEAQIARIERTAEAWGKVAAKLAEASGKSKQVRIDLEATVKLIEFNEAIQKALGISKPGEADEKTAAAKRAAADKLEQAGREKMARAGKLGSEGSETAALATAKAQAEAAEKEMEATRERITFLLEMRDKGALGKMLASPKFALRGYGMSMNSEADIAAALELERGNLAGSQSVVDRYKRAKDAAAGRAAIRSAGETGKKEIEEADALRQAAGDSSRSAVSARVGSAHDKLVAAAENIDAAAASGSVAAVAITMKDFMKSLGQLAKDMQQVRAENARLFRDTETRRREAMNP